MFGKGKEKYKVSTPDNTYTFEQNGDNFIVIISKPSVDAWCEAAMIFVSMLGVMNIAKDSGLIERIGEKISPIMKKLFPSVPKGHKALSYIVMNISLNMLGAGNGATAFGLKAMEELQTLNRQKDTATNDMIMFLAINISSVQIIPFTMLKVRMDLGSQNPGEIILTTLFATIMSTAVAIVSCKMLEKRRRIR